MRKNYLERVAEGVILFDGAMGTRLYDKGVFLNRCFEELCLSRPDMIREIHEEYINCGAQAVETNTYGANRFKLSGYGLGDKVKEINKKGAAIARESAGDDIYVAGSVGPIGHPYTEEEAVATWSEQFTGLKEGGSDLFLLETFSDLKELLLASETAKKLFPDMPVQAQFTLSSLDKNTAIKQAAKSARQLDRSEYVDIVGVNCVFGPSEMLEVVQTINHIVTKPMAVMPNAGYPKMVDGRSIYMSTPDYMSEYAMRYLQGGVSVIGGCCGTGPEHVKKMGQAVLSLDKGIRAIEINHRKESVELHDPVLLSERSHLGQDLAEGKWIESVELVSAAGTDMSGILKKAKELSDKGIRYINIPDGPRASSRMSALVTALELKRIEGIEPILHVCSRDRNLIGLQSDLLGASGAGLQNLLLVTGDPPKVGKYPDASGVFDMDSIGMTRMVKMLNGGVDQGGDYLPRNQKTAFVHGTGINPVSPFPEKEIERAFSKAEEGTEYFFTQPVYDTEMLIRFLEKLKPTGVPVVAGVWPLASYRNALFLNNEVPGVVIPDWIMERMKKHENKEAAREDGIQIAREMIRDFRCHIGGLQVSPPFGRIQSALDVLSGMEED